MGLSPAIRRLYPEVRAGGFPRNHQRVIFYSRVNALLTPNAEVLDFGAGRGKHAERDQGSIAWLTNLRGKCRHVVGFDLDDAVLSNPWIDEPAVASLGQPLPFEDSRFDVIVSWAVFEHIADPAFYSRELSRVLKPGGWLCAWTPNKWGYTSLAARLVPNKLHRRVVMGLTPQKEQDIFPTIYELNTRAALTRWFPDFENYSYIFTGPPVYHGNKVILARLWQAYNWLMPTALGQSLHVFLRKKKAHPALTDVSSAV